jgi:transposase-like protein
MPWKQTSALMERARFVRELASGEWTMSELCEHHGVSRPTGYRWANRFKADGDDGLKELSRAPRGCPHRTANKIEELVVRLKKAHGWGARKLHRLLRKQVAAGDLPLPRHGLRHLETPRLGEEPPTTPEVAASGCGATAHQCSERGMDDRLQGPVQDSRPHLLSAPSISSTDTNPA